jgi:hypothetical protein
MLTADGKKSKKGITIQNRKIITHRDTIICDYNLYLCIVYA